MCTQKPCYGLTQLQYFLQFFLSILCEFTTIVAWQNCLSFYAASGAHSLTDLSSYLRLLRFFSLILKVFNIEHCFLFYTQTEVCLWRLFFAPIFSVPCDLNSVSPGASKSTLSVRLSASSPLCGRERNGLCVVWWIYRWRTRRIAQPRLCLRWALAKPRKKKRWCFQAPTIIIQECNWFGQKENWNVSVEPQKFLKLRFGILVKS